MEGKKTYVLKNLGLFCGFAVATGILITSIVLIIMNFVDGAIISKPLSMVVLMVLIWCLGIDVWVIVNRAMHMKDDE